MGEEVVSSYLRRKLSSILDEAEAEADSGSPSHIISRFRSIESKIKSNSPMMFPVDLLYELIDLVSECRVFSFERRTATLSKKGFGFYFPKLLRHPLSELMFNRRMRRRLHSIVRKIGNCTASQEPPPPPPPPAPINKETFPIEDPSLIIGFEAQAKKIEDWLIPNQEAPLRVVGIVGRCGCGKTALAQKVFASPMIVEEFPLRIWVCLSNMLQFDDRKVRVVNYILREIDDDDDDDPCSLDSLMERLQRGLMGKRYLIVLDDAWRLDEWYGELLSRGLPRESGGAVIVTSRREDVIRRMVVGGDDDDDDKHVNVIRLQRHLSDEICWQIFSQVVQQQGKMYLTDSKLSSIQDDVKRRIDGLPLAAKTLANILPGLLFKTHWIRARDLIIAWADNARYWRWTFVTPPHQELMEEVAELVAEVPRIFIRGRVGLKELVMNTSYSAYLVFKLKTKDQQWMSQATARVSIVCNGKNPECEEERSVFIESEGVQRKGEEEQGWMEINLGHHIFTSNLGDDGDGRSVEASFFERGNNWKSGLVVRGIQFRPNYN